MSATQLSFTLSTSSKVKTVHLLGSWDGYKGQLPLSKDSSKAGKWKGTFRFSSTTLKQGSRYWYYYIIDGYHVSHDPSQSSTKEPTTGRMLNILDVPGSRSSAAPPSNASKKGSAGRYSLEPAKGRSLSPSRIVHPKPSKPYASAGIRQADYSVSPGVDDLASQLEKTSLYKYGNASPPSSVGSSISSRSSGGSSPSSLSSLSDPSSSSHRCTCYGLTKSGNRVKVDCGGRNCSFSDESSSDCSSIDSESEEESEEEEVRPRYQQKSRTAPSRPAPRYQQVRPKQSASSGRRR